ncbi:MAG: adenylosuccinate lyase [Bacteroides sp. SM23_62_1]|nr:MAG: adenylosuccinate lyase [Bacteroides sp. SM23_62_1]
MGISELTAISPIDGRYRPKVDELAVYFSEYGLIRYRIFVEVEYFIALCGIPLPQLATFDPEFKESLRDLYREFSREDADEVKKIEKTTNHDVKAVEYFIKQKFTSMGLDQFKEFIHFGLTSQDINNTAVPASLRDAMQAAYYPLLEDLTEKITSLAHEWENIPMLARTHGQPASPTRLGKEFRVFVERLTNQTEQLRAIPYAAKFGGATGNFNAHHVAFPEVDWIGFANRFVNETLGLERLQTTTQIEHYDHLAAMFHNFSRINTIFIDFARDVWTYISLDYFKQKIVEGEISSSTMPHKVNPIDFENAEGNFGVANALFAHLAAKLPVSRLQRDLTDSTVLRNIGVPLAHTFLAFKSLLKGMNKLIVNPDRIAADLSENWAVVAEAIQTVLRREGYENPYEALKELTRTNKIITREILHKFIETLNIDQTVKEELMRITPENYTGI